MTPETTPESSSSEAMTPKIQKSRLFWLLEAASATSTVRPV